MQAMLSLSSYNNLQLKHAPYNHEVI